MFTHISYNLKNELSTINKQDRIDMAILEKEEEVWDEYLQSLPEGQKQRVLKDGLCRYDTNMFHEKCQDGYYCEELWKSDQRRIMFLSKEGVVQRLEENDIQVSPGIYVENALHIWNYNYMRRVPGFSRGDFAIQDESSMLAGTALSPRAGSLLVDVCASPGGKSLDAADRMLAASAHAANGKSCGQVIARDVSPDKLERFSENLDRMAFPNVKLEQWDGTVLDASLVETADYVLCDVPCSGMGVIGRKPDIKYRLQKEQLDSLVTLQRSILENAWQYLKRGGIMVFCTCTVNPQENEENFKWLTNTFPLEPQSLDDYLPQSLWNEDTKRGYLTLMPGIHACDGFFISRLKRV